MTLRHSRWIHRLAIAALASLASATLLGVFSRRRYHTAVAQPGPPQASTAQCIRRGQSVMPVNAVIVDAQGQPIARFSGAPTPLVVSDFPSDARGKARVETGFGAGSFRIRGFIDPAQLPIHDRERNRDAGPRLERGEPRRHAGRGSALALARGKESDHAVPAGFSGR